jgi:hypothetical protein
MVTKQPKHNGISLAHLRVPPMMSLLHRRTSCPACSDRRIWTAWPRSFWVMRQQCPETQFGPQRYEPYAQFYWGKPCDRVRASAPISRCAFSGPSNIGWTIMPLPSVAAGNTARCTAHSKTSGGRCWNPAAFGMATCRYHGARRRQTVRTGPDHPQYRHGYETLGAKRQRSDGLVRLAEYEELLAGAGKLSGERTRGPKPGEN